LEALRSKTDAAKRVVIDESLRRLGKDVSEVNWFPVIARDGWVALLDMRTQQPLAYLPLDGF